MNNPYDEFMNDDNVSKRKKTMLYWIMKRNEDTKEDTNVLLEYDSEQLEDYFLRLRPSDKNSIYALSSMLAYYLKWCYEKGYLKDNRYKIFSNMDKGAIWEKVKKLSSKKFITHSKYVETIKRIENSDIYNKLYYRTIYEALYEGIYGENLVEMTELRLSDLDGTNVTVRHEDGTSTTFEISEALANDLVELSKEHAWERACVNGSSFLEIKGKYQDSVFKIEERKKKENSWKTYKFAYYNKIKKVNADFVGFPMRPANIYQSGIIYRITQKLKDRGISAEEAFLEKKYKKEVNSVIQEELDRLGDKNTAIKFKRDIIVPFSDIFLEE